MLCICYSLLQQCELSDFSGCLVLWKASLLRGTHCLLIPLAQRWEGKLKGLLQLTAHRSPSTTTVSLVAPKAVGVYFFIFLQKLCLKTFVLFGKYLFGSSTFWRKADWSTREARPAQQCVHSGAIRKPSDVFFRREWIGRFPWLDCVRVALFCAHEQVKYRLFPLFVNVVPT